MDFSDTPEEAEYRMKARAWLREAAGGLERGVRRGFSDDEIADARRWQAAKADAGYAEITWPQDWGGPGGTAIQKVIFGEEEARCGVEFGHFRIGLGMCIPTIMAFADDATKQRFVRPALRGDHIWSQLFSEPAGGSDLAAARTRAVREGDEWVIDGQKIWTSGAHYSDYGIVLTRTNPDAPKHKGLTMFWIDMKSPGIEIRPIHQMSGVSHFNEVFFTGLRVPDSQRLGEVDQGWKVALVTLMNERVAVGGSFGPDVPMAIELARKLDVGDGQVVDDPVFRDRLVDWFLQSEGLRLTRMRSITALSRGQTPGPENSIGKIVSANQLQDMASAMVDYLELWGFAPDTDGGDTEIAALAAPFRASFMSSPGTRIAGGTDEIMKNIIAERVLGLPGDIRVDKDVPFRDLASG